MANLSIPACAQFEQHIAEYPQDDAIANGVGQHHGYDGNERRKFLCDILHVYLCDGRHHFIDLAVFQACFNVYSILSVCCGVHPKWVFFDGLNPYTPPLCSSVSPK